MDELNKEVKNVEESLEQSKNNIAQMDSQMNIVKKTVDETNKVFALLQEQIEEISKVAERLEMSASSEENQSVVESIVEAMGSYKKHMNLVVEDAKQLQELSATMINTTE